MLIPFVVARYCLLLTMWIRDFCIVVKLPSLREISNGSFDLLRTHICSVGYLLLFSWRSVRYVSYCLLCIQSPVSSVLAKSCVSQVLGFRFDRATVSVRHLVYVRNVCWRDQIVRSCWWRSPLYHQAGDVLSGTGD
jgi:hypothetical protein